jgi:hypothetical protein
MVPEEVEDFVEEGLWDDSDYQDCFDSDDGGYDVISYYDDGIYVEHFDDDD